MTDWIRNTVADYGAEGTPMHSCVAVELLRQNSVCLQENSPFAVGSPIENDATAGIATSATSFSVSTSILARFAKNYQRGRDLHYVRGFRMYVRAVVGAASAGQLRLVVGPSFRVPDATPEWPYVYEDTGASAVGTTAGWHQFDVSLGQANCSHSLRGTTLDDRGPLSYPTVCVTLCGRVSSGSGPLTISAITPLEAIV